MNRYDITITSLAYDELKQEMRYSLQKWGLRHMRRYKKALLKYVETIAINPERYPLKPVLGSNIRQAIFKGNYIHYRINETEQRVEILGFPNIHKASETYH